MSTAGMNLVRVGLLRCSQPRLGARRAVGAELDGARGAVPGSSGGVGARGVAVPGRVRRGGTCRSGRARGRRCGSTVTGSAATRRRRRADLRGGGGSRRTAAASSVSAPAHDRCCGALATGRPGLVGGGHRDPCPRAAVGLHRSSAPCAPTAPVLPQRTQRPDELQALSA